MDLRPRAEEEDHAVQETKDQLCDSRSREDRVELLHQGMGKAHFSTVDGTISGRFDDSKEWCKVGIEDYAVNEILAEGQSNYRIHTRRAYTFIESISKVHSTRPWVRGGGLKMMELYVCRLISLEHQVHGLGSRAAKFESPSVISDCNLWKSALHSSLEEHFFTIHNGPRLACDDVHLGRIAPLSSPIN